MRKCKTVAADEEGVAVITDYIINIGTAMMVISVLVLSLQGTVDNVQETAASTTLRVANEQLASQIAEADTIANAGTEMEGRVTVELQDSVARQGYSLTVTEDSVNMASGTTNVSTTVNTTNELVNASFTGGGTRLVHFNDTHIWIT